jgi:hypothetical protein
MVDREWGWASGCGLSGKIEGQVAQDLYIRPIYNLLSTLCFPQGPASRIRVVFAALPPRKLK